MNNTKLKLHKIVVTTILIIFLLLVFAIILSIFWPQPWNPQLCSLFLNIIASLIGVSAGVLVAIFIVERYLEHQRRETQRKENLLKVYWLSGGLSVLTAMIMHLSFFLLYGAGKWQALMSLDNVQTKVPETIGDFIPWLIYTKDKLKPRITKEKLDLFEKEFEKTPESAIGITRRDLGTLVTYLETCATRIRDQLFLFYPFIDEHFQLTSSLIFFARALDDAVHDSGISLALMKKDGKPPLAFSLDDKGKDLFNSLGKEAVEVSKLSLADYTVKNT